MRPEPKAMKIAIPLAVLASMTEPASDSAVMTSTASTSCAAGSSGLPGHQPPIAPVIASAAKKTAST